jgi:hypothetical protein
MSFRDLAVHDMIRWREVLRRFNDLVHRDEVRKDRGSARLRVVAVYGNESIRPIIASAFHTPPISAAAICSE